MSVCPDTGGRSRANAEVNSRHRFLSSSHFKTHKYHLHKHFTSHSPLIHFRPPIRLLLGEGLRRERRVLHARVEGQLRLQTGLRGRRQGLRTQEPLHQEQWRMPLQLNLLCLRRAQQGSKPGGNPVLTLNRGLNSNSSRTVCSQLVPSLSVSVSVQLQVHVWDVACGGQCRVWVSARVCLFSKHLRSLGRLSNWSGRTSQVR